MHDEQIVQIRRWHVPRRVPASKSSTIESELQSIASWFETNNLTLNTKEIYRNCNL